GIIALAVLLLAVTFGFYALFSEPSAGEIVEMSLSSMEDVKSYRFTLDAEILMNMSSGEHEESIPMSMSGEGAVNLEEKKLWMKTESIVNSGELPGEMAMEMEIYMVGNAMYMKLASEKTGEQWLKMEIPEEMIDDAWSSENQLEQQKMLLQSSDVRKLGEENIRGEECYVLELKIDAEKLMEMIQNQTFFGGETLPMSEVEKEAMNRIMNNTEISVKEWISKSTGLPLKSEMVMRMHLSGEEFNLSEDSEEMEITMEMTMKMEMEFYDYNQNIEIELPEDAENAVEVPFYSI
ncbi:MAG: hypothetical protein H5T46_06045, partial [Archaeoglobi archaeon]|nr:hypothetical protein [Candidatus Mnemosynella sp.]